MWRLSRIAEQASNLVVYDRGDLVVMAQVDAPGYWSLSTKVDSRSGHALLAFTLQAERADVRGAHNGADGDERAQSGETPRQGLPARL
jgi:DNA-binding IclR family transcriptional regulator